MGQINIIIIVDTEKIIKDFPKGGEVAHPEKYVIMQDDEVIDPEDINLAEITTSVNPGDIIMWTIKAMNKKHDIQFTNVECPPGILLEPPVLFYNLRKCIGVINKNFKRNQKLGYFVEFYMDGDPTKTWYWDPYMERHDPPPPPPPEP